MARENSLAGIDVLGKTLPTPDAETREAINVYLDVWDRRAEQYLAERYWRSNASLTTREVKEKEWWQTMRRVISTIRPGGRG